MLVAAALALAVHARTFDFVCDDAFIALREAQNLALHGAPVYNLGERVEAATSPAWVVLLGVGLLLRVPPVALLQGLSLAGGALLVAATWSLARRLLPRRPTAQTFVLIALVLTAPVAAWSGGGLETPLYAACVTFAFARIDVLERDRTSRASIVLGVVLALSCLVRLEALVLVVLAAFALRDAGRDLLARMLAIALAPVMLLTIFRLAYYGLPLPHTFYAKTGDHSLALAAHGLGYVKFCLTEIGVVESLLLLASPFVIASSATISTARIFVPLSIGYVVVIGGDFLDLYRFFVPLFPVLYVTFAVAGVTLLGRYASSPALRVAAGLLVLVPHGVRQVGLSARSMAATDHRRTDVGIEPLGWTKNAFREWSATGIWLARVAEPGDTLATPAAGALPFFSTLPNYDLLGIAAPDVARNGNPFWVRPGHTRFATTEQIQKRAPAYLFLGTGSGWEERGYDGMNVRVADGISVYLLVRHDRSAKLLARSDVEAVAR
jgi:arabinofuranosyltransferase